VRPEAIQDDGVERLTRHGELDASGIRVRVENGEVNLLGADLPGCGGKRPCASPPVSRQSRLWIR
jgi:hypothetical protein